MTKSNPLLADRAETLRAETAKRAMPQPGPDSRRKSYVFTDWAMI